MKHCQVWIVKEIILKEIHDDDEIQHIIYFVEYLFASVYLCWVFLVDIGQLYILMVLILKRNLRASSYVR